MTAPATAAANAPAGSSRNSRRGRRAGFERQTDRPGRDECAERVEVSVREIEDAHHAVDQAQSAGDQKEHGAVQQRIQNVDYEDTHGEHSFF